MISIKQKGLTYLLCKAFCEHYALSSVCKLILMTLLLGLMMPFQTAGAATNTGIDEEVDSASYIYVGFPFDYYGNYQNYFKIHRNGTIQFQMGARLMKPLMDSFNNTCLPADSQDNTLFVFWDELQTHIDGQPSGSVLYEVQGEAPDRKMVVQWSDIYFADTGLPMGTFQAILYEGSNQIKYQYHALSGERSSGSDATIGIQGEMDWWSENPQVKFKQIGCNQTNQIRSGQAITFTPVMNEQGEWDYVVDLNAVFDPVMLYELTPSVSGSSPEEYETYTNLAPEWTWKSYPQLNTYQIEIRDHWEYGDILATVDVNNTNHYSYGEGLVHGKRYVARLRASLGNNKWTEWSDFSYPVTVDTQNPSAEVKTFLRTDADEIWLNFNLVDEYSGIAGIEIEVATDETFETIVYQQKTEDYYPFQKTLNGLPQSGDLYVRISAVDKARNQSGYSQAFALIDRPVIHPQKRYSKESLSWSWIKDSRYTTFEVEAFTDEGDVVYKKELYPNNPPSANYTVHGRNVRARVRGRIADGSRWGAWSNWSVPTTIDRVAPTPSLNTFNRTGPEKVAVGYGVIDDLSGVANIVLEMATDSAFSNIVRRVAIPVDTTYYEVEGMPQWVSLYARIKATDAVGNESVYTPTLEIGLEAPQIRTPVNGVVVYQPVVTVSGYAHANGQVQLYLNGETSGSRIPVSASGQFSGEVTLTAEGVYSVSATAHNGANGSELSPATQVNYEIPLPNASFVTPSGDSTIALPVLLEVSASDVLGIAKVEFYDDSILLGQAVQAPYQQPWNVSFADNGDHTLKSVVTSVSGKSVTLERNVKVDVAPEKPVVPPTPYTGKVQSISPAISYGNQPIRITGTAVDRTTSAPMADRPLKLILDVGGFKRNINIVTNAAGAFSYNFVPQENDKGTYQVSAIHPDEVDAPSQGSFNINRISFNISGYKLSAARNFPVQFTVKATASGPVEGLRWIALAEDQPSEALPQGIVIGGGGGIDIAEGRSAQMAITVTADDSALETGTIYLRALSEDSDELVRGFLRLDYKLVQAEPFLYIQKSTIQTGVKQGESVSETITLANKGLVSAQNVRAQLLDEQGNTPPAWMFLANTGGIGTVNVGDEVAVQITAQPGSDVADGIYRFKLRVSADNTSSSDAFITVAVTQSGIGGVRFDVADIYTATLDENEQPILGVKGVTIKLQNEAVLSEQYDAVTGSDGTALFEELPPGVYLFRASAKNHMDVSGRVRIRPGVIIDQHIFLDYQLISIEFGVTETTINDIYDIVLEATYQTQVPAPVVLLEPLSINIGGMQVGEERTGQLTLTNYGLIEARTVKFTPPQSDSEFKYEFFADIPDTLPPKTRIVIPYRVTALGEAGTQGDDAQGRSSPSTPSIRALAARSTRSTQCTSYTSRYWVGYEYECVNGALRKGSNGGYYTYLKGQHCTGGSGISWGGGWGGGFGGGGGGGWGGTPSPVPMAPECVPECPTGDCDSGGQPANR